jgi:AraC-like DNA-binding protein
MRDRLSVEPLTAIVALLRARTVLSKVVSGAGRWAVRYAKFGHPSFCLMLTGSCWLRVEGATTTSLEPGDFVLLPETPGFSLASDRKALGNPSVVAAEPGSTRERRHGDPMGEATMRMLGGYFECDPTNAALLLGLLPPVVHVQASDSGADRLAWIVRAIRDETSAQQPGGEPILVRLVEIMLIEALRWRPVGASAHLTGLLAGLADPRLSIALRLLHEGVPHRWTVADLARQAGMSRAAFAARFSRTLGMPPMDYLLRWRMALAKDLLRHDGLSLAEVADAIGYQSASAFSTAFSRCVGQAPSTFARENRVRDRPARPGTDSTLLASGSGSR